MGPATASVNVVFRNAGLQICSTFVRHPVRHSFRFADGARMSDLSFRSLSTRRSPLALALAWVLVVSILVGCQPNTSPGVSGAGRGAGGPVAVGVVTLAPQRVSVSTELPGRVNAPLVAEVRPQVRGLIQAKLFTEGARVKAGQVLYQIEPDSYRIARASAQAAVAKAQATLDAARLTAQRRADLFKVQAVSQQDVQDAQAAQQQAEADLAIARANLDAAQLNLSRTQVTAPISGQVDVSNVTPGALVTADQSTALTTVRQLDPIQVDVSQSSAELLRLKRDWASGKFQRIGTDSAQIKLILEDGSAYPLTGKLSFAGVSVNTSTGAVTLRAQFPNPDGLLLPGMYVRAVLETGSAESALVVPQAALQRDARGNASVWIVGADGKVQRRSVTVGRTLGGGWLVSEGVQTGERVVVEGLQKIKPGDSVQAHPVAASASGAASAAASAASAR